MSRTKHAPPRREYREVVTPEAFCWRYAVGCIDMREMEAQRDEEHLISKGYFPHLRDCITSKRMPSDDVSRRVFRRPFDALGTDCTLEDMQHYWRVSHRSLSEKTPVFKVQVAPYTDESHKRRNSIEGMWEAWIFDPRTDKFERLRLHNIHEYALEHGAWVYVHITGSNFGIIAEEVPEDDLVYRAFAS